jgi:hypothetical protein
VLRKNFINTYWFILKRTEGEVSKTNIPGKYPRSELKLI